MKTVQEMENEAFMRIVQKLESMEQDLKKAQDRIKELETVITNQRAVIKELQ